MDFMCDGCGKWHWIPPESRTKQEAIENLELLTDTLMREPWIVVWLNHHEPELMRKFYAAIEGLVKK
jgi:hypothetical protein